MPEKTPSNLAGKIVVGLIPFSMVLAYFMMHSQGHLFQTKVLVPFFITSVLVVGAFVLIVALLSKFEKRPSTMKMVTAFFMTLLVIMALVVFRLNGLF